MTPLLKSLLGSGSKDRELAEAMRTVLHELQQERGRCEALVHSVRAAAERLQQLGEPVARVGSDVDAVAARLADLEHRSAAIARLSTQLQVLDERAEGMAQGQQQAAEQIASTLEHTREIRAVFEELSGKVDLAVELKENLGAFLEVDKPFQQLRGEAEEIRGQVHGTGEQLARLREQHDRLIDAHKLAVSKTEALDRRRDDLGRSLQDKERRVAAVEQAVLGMDGIQHTVTDVRREIGTLKALGDSVVQRSAALEAQREAIERALAQAEHLERAMRQIDAGVRQQQENEKSLAALQDQVAALRSLQEAVVARSGEITQFQRATDEQTRATRQDLAALTDEMKKTVERFDFEGRGLESVSQRVADLRSALTDCENRFKALNEPSLAVGEVKSRAKDLAEHLQALSSEVGQVDRELEQFRTIRRTLAETGRTARDIGAQLGRVEEARPVVEEALRHVEQLGATHAMVRDALEQAQIAREEIARAWERQSENRTWLAGVEQSVGELRERAGALECMGPTIEVVQQQAQHLQESMTVIESRRAFLEDLQRRMAELATLGGTLDERGRELQARMEAAEQRFEGLAASAGDAERLTLTVASVSSQLATAERKTDDIGKSVAAIVARSQAVEGLAEQTAALRPELEQRHRALKEAARDLQRASALRQEAATSVQQLDELATRLAAALSAAGHRATEADELAAQLEARTADLKSVEKRLGQFEERLAEWDPVEKEIARSLEQLAARQGIVEALQADLERMFTMAEKTASDVRQITSAHQEIEQSRALLVDVMSQLEEVRDTANGLEERRRQMTKAEERLARAEALLVDVRSSLEALQGQKAIVDQAVEKAGSLQILVKQAEATIDSLREEREMTARVRTAVTLHLRDDDEDGGEDEEEQAKAA